VPGGGRGDGLGGGGDILSIALFEPFFYTCIVNTKLLALLLGIKLTNNVI